ncbi:hypothetical protein GQ53DRAFT_506788 [Thozetella sp. PMI_491]|nr:hypothetical protein GQ53DRAFT_506788 [Thozetella sp. PMI_491]
MHPRNNSIYRPLPSGTRRRLDAILRLLPSAKAGTMVEAGNPFALGPHKPVEKIKWTRASVSRVRTGCKTCKVRHLKCGEEKPFCLRCKRAGITCDGYEEPKPRPRRKQQAIYEHQLLYSLFHPHNPLPQSLSTFPSAFPLEGLCLHHAISSTASVLSDSSSLPHFWRDVVLPLSHSETSIKHALIALGAAHRAFLSPETTQFDAFTLQQYNLAIRHITALMKDPSITNSSTTLVCCLLFVCLENLRGRYEEAVRHLRAGSRLLCHLNEDTRSDLASQPAACPRTIQNKSQIDDIALMFSRLGIDTGLLIEDQVVTHLSLYSKPADLDDGNACIPFPDAATAMGELRQVEIDTDIVCCSHPNCFHEQCIFPEGNQCYPCPNGGMSWGREDASPEQKAVYQRFCRWSERFDLYLESLKSRPHSAEEGRQAMLLSLQQKTWRPFFEDDDAFQNPMTPSQKSVLEDILRHAELIIKTGNYSSHPVFSFDANVLPCLGMVVYFSRDPDLIRTIVALLRSINLREGLWDSRELADFYEAEFMTKTDHDFWFNRPYCSSIDFGGPCFDHTRSSVPEYLIEKTQDEDAEPEDESP